MSGPSELNLGQPVFHCFHPIREIPQCVRNSIADAPDSGLKIPADKGDDSISFTHQGDGFRGHFDQLRRLLKFNHHGLIVRL